MLEVDYILGCFNRPSEKNILCGPLGVTFHFILQWDCILRSHAQWVFGSGYLANGGKKWHVICLWYSGPPWMIPMESSNYMSIWYSATFLSHSERLLCASSAFQSVSDIFVSLWWWCLRGLFQWVILGTSSWLHDVIHHVFYCLRGYSKERFWSYISHWDVQS